MIMPEAAGPAQTVIKPTALHHLHRHGRMEPAADLHHPAAGPAPRLREAQAVHPVHHLHAAPGVLPAKVQEAAHAHGTETDRIGLTERE